MASAPGRTAAPAAVGPHIRRNRRTPFATGFLAGATALLLYTLTSAPGLEWQDSGVHQYRILIGQVENPLGLALSHPLHHWLGRAVLALAGGENPTAALNLLSAVCGAVAIGVLAGVVTALTRSLLAGLLAAVVAGLAHSFWQMSVITETYSLHAALLAIEWALLLAYVRRGRPLWLVAVFAVNGLHVANHLLGLLSLATYGVFALVELARRRLPAGALLAALTAWVVTAAPYWTLCVAHGLASGDAAGTLRSAFFGGGPGGEDWSQDVLNTRLGRAQLQMAVMTLGYNFPSLAGPLAVWALARRWPNRRRAFYVILAVQTVLYFGFVLRYSITDLYTFFVPLCLLTGLWAGCGARRVLRGRPPQRRTVLGVLLLLGVATPPLVYAVFPAWAEQRGLLRDRLRDLPARNEYRYFFQPWRTHDNSAEQFASNLTNLVGSRGWIIADSTTAFPVACFLLTDSEPGEIRVYWLRRGLFPPDLPALDDAELADFLRRGGRVFTTAAPEIESLLGEAFELDQRGRAWQVRPRAESPGGGS